MAKIERSVRGNIKDISVRLQQAIIDGSISASITDSSEFSGNGAVCSVCVFERYSMLGGNRLSLTVTLFQSEENIVHVSGITAGGSTGMFLKINTFGEEAFLSKFEDALNKVEMQTGNI